MLTHVWRIEQVETLLKTQDPVVTTPELPQTNFGSGQRNVSGVGLNSVTAGDFNISTPALNIGNGVDTERWGFNGESPSAPIDNMNFTADLNMGMGLDDNTFTWEMIGLGLEEPLPPQDTIDELYVFTGIPRRRILISFIQTSSIFRQDPSFTAYDPQISIFGSHEFVCKSIHSSRIQAICYSSMRSEAPVLLYLSGSFAGSEVLCSLETLNSAISLP